MEKSPKQLLYDEADELAKRFNITDAKEYRAFVEDKVKELRKELADRERDERAEKRAHDIALKEKEKEQEEMKLKHLALKKQEKELALQKDLREQEEIKLKLNQEEIRLKLNHELEMARLQTNAKSENTSTSHKSYPRFKMPTYEHKTENINDFLDLFEHTCKGYNIPESEWYYHLIPQLKDKGREALAFISKETTEYSVIREQLIKYFNHSHDWYRMKFHSYILTDKTEPRAFVTNVKSYLKTWMELIKIDTKNPNEIIELIVVDKVLEMSSKELFTHIMERKVKTMEELIDAISNFKDSHPHIQLTKSNESCNILQSRRYGSNSPPRGRGQSNFNCLGKRIQR